MHVSPTIDQESTRMMAFQKVCALLVADGDSRCCENLALCCLCSDDGCGADVGIGRAARLRFDDVVAFALDRLPPTFDRR